MREREEQIEETKVQMNTVEDRVFKDFCKTIGVKNIRQYEERELGKQQERLKRRVEYENNINRVSTQLEYERKREEQLRTNVDKFERMVQDIEDQLEAAKSTEQSQMQHIDTGNKAMCLEYSKKLAHILMHLSSFVDLYFWLFLYLGSYFKRIYAF